MSSKPPTPMTQRHYFPGENDTKIPQPSPQPFRRSVSLRLRTSKSYENTFPLISPTKPTHNQNFSSLRRGGSCLAKKSSKSFDTTDNCNHLSETAPTNNGAVPKNRKIDTNVPVTQQSQHGMVSCNFFISFKVFLILLISHFFGGFKFKGDVPLNFKSSKVSY